MYNLKAFWFTDCFWNTSWGEEDGLQIQLQKRDFTFQIAVSKDLNTKICFGGCAPRTKLEMYYSFYPKLKSYIDRTLSNMLFVLDPGKRMHM